ncbi:MAG: hypothetical protein GXO93_01780, partial [FCB group bacterium]|nr:hypothetical protein [FCB group bacterium]
MKRLFLLAVVSLISLILALTSCDNLNNSTGVNPPGSNTDTNFTSFWDEFQGMDNLTGNMVDQTFGFIDSIFAISGFSKVSATTSADTLIYHQGSQFWYVESTFLNEDDSSTTFHVIDSLQFWHGSSIVQWPNPDSMTKVISYLTMTASGEGIDSASMHQNIVITALLPGSDTITINGTGDIMGAYAYQDVYTNDTTNCSANMNYNVTYTNIQINVALMDSTEACPFAGSVNYSGSFNMSCAGGKNITLSGDWGIQETFNNGIITYHITHNNQGWNEVDTCTYDNNDTTWNDTTGNDTTGNDTTGSDSTVSDSIMFTSFMREFEGADEMSGNNRFFAFLSTLDHVVQESIGCNDY